MTSRWSSRVTLTGAAAAGCPVARAMIRSVAIKGVFMTSSSGLPDIGCYRVRPERAPKVPAPFVTTDQLVIWRTTRT
jgi:hypothetical protein